MNFEKIKKMLLKYHVPEEQADAFIADLQAEPDADPEAKPAVDPEAKGEDVTTKDPEAVEDPAKDDQSDPTDAPDDPSPDVPIDGQGDGDPVDPVDPTNAPVNDPAADPAAQDPSMEMATADPTVDPAQAAGYDDTELRNKVDELTKANEGLVAKFDSLVESLNKSGIVNITTNQDVVGMDENSCPANPLENDAMANFLAKANGRRY